MATLPARNTFEGGSDETTITTGNSGGGSGTALDIATIGAGHAAVYDTAQAAHGAMSARVDLGLNTGTVLSLGYTFTETTSPLYGYCYFRWPGSWTGPSTMRIIGWETTGGTGIARIVMGRDVRQLVLVDQNFVSQATTAGSMSENVWYRVAWRLIPSDTVGEMEVWIYEGDSSTPISGGNAVATGIDTGPSVDRVTYGSLAGWTGSAYTFWLDDFNVNASGDLGPPLTASRRYKRLVGPLQIATSEANLYTVPAGTRTRVRNIHLSNPGVSEVDVSLEIGGVLSLERPVPAGDVYAARRPIEVTLEAGEVISGYASDTGVVVVIDGVEEAV